MKKEKLIIKTAALSANFFRSLMEETSTDAIDTVLSWCDDKASIEDVKKAAVKAIDAYTSCTADYNVTYAVARAAYVAIYAANFAM